MPGAGGAERRRRDRAFEVQLAAVALDLARHVEVEEQVAERLVGLVERPLHLLRERVGLGVAAGEGCRAHLRQPRLRVGVVPLAGAARPQRVVVEGQPLVPRVAEHHRAEATVADRQRLDPCPRGLLVPQAQGRLGDGRAAHEDESREGGVARHGRTSHAAEGTPGAARMTASAGAAGEHGGAVAPRTPTDARGPRPHWRLAYPWSRAAPGPPGRGHEGQVGDRPVPALPGVPRRDRAVRSRGRADAEGGPRGLVRASRQARAAPRQLRGERDASGAAQPGLRRAAGTRTSRRTDAALARAPPPPGAACWSATS